MAIPQVFVSHSHTDNEYCRAFVAALRQGLGDDRDAVWYDEHNLGWGKLQQEIDRELLKRQHFIAILSPAAVASEWVKTEIYAAQDLLRKGKMRTFQLVIAVPCDVMDMSPTLGGYKRIELQDGLPFPPATAARKTLAVISAAHGEILPPLGPAPAPANSVPAHHLTPMPFYNLGYRGYSIGGVECILPPVCPILTGDFIMGSDTSRDLEARADEMPQYLVEVDGFALGQHPVTVVEFACAVDAQGAYEPRKAYPDVDWRKQWRHPYHPVIGISWNNALAYVRWLATVTGQPWRLPSEAEWEKAARGTDGRIYPWGDAFDKTLCNVLESGVSTTTHVGRYPAGESPYHVHDMAGNVWEWTSSLYQHYPYRKDDGRENLESTGARTLRGGSWAHVGKVARASFRCHTLQGGGFPPLKDIEGRVIGAALHIDGTPIYLNDDHNGFRMVWSPKR